MAITFDPATMPLCAIGVAIDDGVRPMVARQVRDVGRVAQRDRRDRPGDVADVVGAAALGLLQRRFELLQLDGEPFLLVLDRALHRLGEGLLVLGPLRQPDLLDVGVRPRRSAC